MECYRQVNDEGRLHMSRDVRVLQAALDHLQRRRLLPPGPLSLEFVDTYIAALHLQPEQEAYPSTAAPSHVHTRHAPRPPPSELVTAAAAAIIK